MDTNEQQETAKFHDAMLAAFWNEFRQDCIPVEAGIAQHIAMKQAFLAGASSFRLAFGAAVDDAESEDGQIANADNLDRQLATLCANLMEDAMRAIEGRLDEELPDEPKHRVKFVDGRGMTPAQIEELDGIIAATVARFEEANRESAK